MRMAMMSASYDMETVGQLVSTRQPILRSAAEGMFGLLARLPLRTRRLLLWSAFGIMRHHDRFKPDTGDIMRIALTLHMPVAQAARIAGLTVFHNLLFSLEWLALKNRTAAGLLNDAVAVRLQDDETLRWASAQKTVILATLHMGSYSTSLARLLHAHFQGRQIVIVKSKAVTGTERDAIAKLAVIGVTAELLFLERPETFLELARRVRRGAVLITLVDLPDAYGRAEDVELLWHSARMTIGVAELSALCQAPVVLFRTVSGVGGDTVVVDSVLDAGVMTDARRRKTANALAAFVNAAVVDHPEQWHMWGRLPEYYGARPC